MFSCAEHEIVLIPQVLLLIAEKAFFKRDVDAN